MNPKPRHHVGDSLAIIREQGLHGINLPVPDGFLRGMDVLGEDLVPGMIRSARVYSRHHDHLPNLIDPTTFTEKQVLFKFFGLIPTQSPSDKLRSIGFLPKSLRDDVKVPEKIWISDKPQLPGNDEIPPGDYYFKSNHSSGTHLPITFPVPDAVREKAEKQAEHWLTRIHNQRLSLWWYETMPRNVFLEEDLRHPDGDAPDWKFFVVNGKVNLFQVDTGRFSNHIQTIYDRDGNFLNHELYYGSGKPVDMPPYLPKMIELAEGVGRNFDFIRVDMFTLNGDIYLGEIGLVPNGANIRIRSAELDERLGRAWQAPWLGKPQADWSNGHYSRVRYEPWDVPCFA